MMEYYSKYYTEKKKKKKKKKKRKKEREKPLGNIFSFIANAFYYSCAAVQVQTLINEHHL